AYRRQANIDGPRHLNREPAAAQSRPTGSMRRWLMAMTSAWELQAGPKLNTSRGAGVGASYYTECIGDHSDTPGFDQQARYRYFVTSWADHAVWWHVYPLGFTGAEKAELAEEAPVRHRLRQLEGWLDYAVELGCSGLLLGDRKS